MSMQIPEIVLKHAPWSVSMANTAISCPHAFHNKYVLRKKPVEQEAVATTVGTVVHKILELGVQEVPLDRVYKQVRNGMYELTHHVQEEVLMFRGAIEDFLRGIDTFKRTFKVKKIYPERKVAITPDFKSCHFFDKKGLFRGVIDLTMLTGDNRAVVIDHKSGAVKPLHFFQDQLTGYAVMLEATAGVHAVRSAIHFVGSDPGPRGKRTVWASEHSADSIKRILRLKLINHLERAAKVAEASQEPNECWMCNFCGYKPICPAYV